MWLPPAPVYHFYTEVWRLMLASCMATLVLVGVINCWRSEVCSSVAPLIMLMPGATVGAGAVLLVVMLTVLLPFTSNMTEDVTRLHNPSGFFLVLPCLALAVLFWGMSAHWVRLLWAGVRICPHRTCSLHIVTILVPVRTVTHRHRCQPKDVASRPRLAQT